MHEILAGILSGESSPDEALGIFMEEFDAQCYAAVPVRVRDDTYSKMLNFLASYDPSLILGYEILGVERRFLFKVGGYPFQGIVDLLLRGKDGRIILVDHKSSRYPLLKSGKIAKASAGDFLSHKRQMYLYSTGIRNTYGRFPDILAWNHFKDNQSVAIPFSDKEYEQSVQWALDTIGAIQSDTQFSERKSFFYCNHLCEYRNTCEYRKEGDEE